MKRDRRAYNQGYFKTYRAELLESMHRRYQAKQERVSAELLRHLQEHPAHSLGRTEIICPDCERLRPFKAAVCLECGRQGLAQLSIHLRGAHKMSREDYLEKRGLNRRTSLTSAEFRAKQARPENLSGGKRFTSETARRVNLGRHWTLREPRLKSKGAAPKATKLSRRLRRINAGYWPIAQQRLAGKEYKHIAGELKISAAIVNTRCREMGFPAGEPACFWHGEVIGDRQLQELLRIGNLTVKAAALRMGVKPHRLSRALGRAGKPLPLDLGQKTIAELARLKAAHKGPEKLFAYERGELRWKAKVLRREIRALHDELSTASAINEPLCRLACAGKIATLFWWGREFSAWLSQQYPQAVRAAALRTGFKPRPLKAEFSRAFEVARDFLAHEYGVQPETVRRATLLSEPATRERDDLKRRRRLADLTTAFGQKPRLLTGELLPRLRSLGWHVRSGKQLGAILGPLGMRSRNIWTHAHVLKGYDREDLKVYSTAEAAELLGLAYITLKHYVWKKAIPVPPIVSRPGVRGRGSVRVWTEADITAAKTALELRAPKHRRPRANR